MNQHLIGLRVRRGDSPTAGRIASTSSDQLLVVWPSGTTTALHVAAAGLKFLDPDKLAARLDALAPKQEPDRWQDCERLPGEHPELHCAHGKPVPTPSGFEATGPWFPFAGSGMEHDGEGWTSVHWRRPLLRKVTD